MTETISAVTEYDEESPMSTSPKPASRLEERRAVRAASPARAAVSALASSGALDDLFAKIDTGDVELAGDGEFVAELIKATLERGLHAELSEHLGYEKGDPAAAAYPNSRNGTTPKTVATQIGDVDLAIPRDRDGSFSCIGRIGTVRSTACRRSC